MPRFFFPVNYGGLRCEDVTGDVFSSATDAEKHARIIAEELSRNHSKSVTVFVVGEDQP
jgi:hypothetical protein